MQPRDAPYALETVGAPCVALRAATERRRPFAPAAVACAATVLVRHCGVGGALAVYVASGRELSY